MAAITRKRSAFSVFKGANQGKENSLECFSTPNLIAGIAEYEEHKMAVKSQKRARRGSLPNSMEDQQPSNEKEALQKTPPTNQSKKAKRSQTCKSEPRLQSLRKSLRRKRRDQPKLNENIQNASNDAEQEKTEIIPSKDFKKPVARANSSSSSSSLATSRISLCHVQVTSEDNLEAENQEILNESFTPDEAMTWLIKPIDKSKFFKDVWEKKPLLLKRRQPTYNDGWFSTKEFDHILREKEVKYGVNLDITKYTNGKRETLNPEGRAHPPTVWDFYEKGCSIRMLNPQAFSKSVWRLTSILQSYFGAFVGANMYLTPPGSQGFAPHYDDIEAFVIQLEGKKQWRLYSPRNVAEVLPRFSSENLSEEGVGEPILDKTLEPGDCLYFPRGYIHQATTLEDTHSLHITLSVYQQNTWGDFLEKLLPRALQVAMEEDTEFRKGLPIGYLDHIGVCNSEKISFERSEFLKRVQQLVMKLSTFAPIDVTADEMAVDSIQDKLPPVLTKDELMCSIHGSGAFWDNDHVRGVSLLHPDSEFRLLRPDIARLVGDEDGGIIHHSMENSRNYHEFPAQTIKISKQELDAAEYVINSYPTYVKVEDVPLRKTKEKLKFVKRLYDSGILRTKTPLVQDSVV